MKKKKKKIKPYSQFGNIQKFVYLGFMENINAEVKKLLKKIRVKK